MMVLLAESPAVLYRWLILLSRYLFSRYHLADNSILRILDKTVREFSDLNVDEVSIYILIMILVFAS